MRKEVRNKKTQLHISLVYSLILSPASALNDIIGFAGCKECDKRGGSIALNNHQYTRRIIGNGEPWPCIFLHLRDMTQHAIQVHLSHLLIEQDSLDHCQMHLEMLRCKQVEERMEKTWHLNRRRKCSIHSDRTWIRVSTFALASVIDHRLEC